MGDIVDIITFIVNVIGTWLNALDEVQFRDSGFSMLAVFCAIIFLDLIVWFIQSLIKEGYFQEIDDEGGNNNGGSS